MQRERLRLTIPSGIWGGLTGERQTTVLDLFMSKEEQLKQQENNPVLNTTLNAVTSLADPTIVIPAAKSFTAVKEIKVGATIVNGTLKTSPKGAAEAGIGNPFPANGTFSSVMKSEYAEAIANKGALVGKDEFWITAADDMMGITTKQGAAERLALINESGALRTQGDAILNFELNNYSGIASPFNRNNSGFVPGGLTGGGVREWVVPGNTRITNPTITYLK